ncbi:PD-(D/E)XK nuclease family protein [Caldivirga sp. UBA161]|uniref:PD-(D/E)XK nuclease family protein n=1 Tax=Caldivirga sp. UBA161 TaxID=1915569 RepID=UPI0025C314B7|nr:PD-(D/E)XK nuclease family protein [Caldivirga sp. UBA161]
MEFTNQAPELTIIEGKPILKWGEASYLIPRLKHGALFLMVNQLAVQLRFCEYRIHLDFTKGRVIGNEAVDGLYEHARQFGSIADEFSLEPGWDPVVVNRGEEGVSFFNMRMRNWIGKADFTKPYVEERSVVVLIKGVPVLGLPDLIINRDGKPWLIIELKTTNRASRLGFIEPREAYQVEAYYHFLRMMGLGVEGAIVVKLIRGSGVKVIDYVDALIRAFTNGVNYSRLGNGISMHVVKVRDASEFMKETEQAVDYWLGLRNAVASPSPGKCRVCDHRLHCPYSLSS